MLLRWSNPEMVTYASDRWRCTKSCSDHHSLPQCKRRRTLPKVARLVFQIALLIPPSVSPSIFSPSSSSIAACLSILPSLCQTLMPCSSLAFCSSLPPSAASQQDVGKATPSAIAALRVPSSLKPHHSLPSSTIVIVDGLRVAIALSPSSITLGRKGVLNTSTSVESKEKRGSSNNVSDEEKDTGNDSRG